MFRSSPAVVGDDEELDPRIQVSVFFLFQNIGNFTPLTSLVWI